MKRILFVDPGDFIGGAELFTLDLCNHLAHGDTYTIHVAGNGLRAYTQALTDRVQYHTIAIKRLKMLSIRAVFRFIHAIFLLIRLVHTQKIDIIQSNSIRAHIVCSFVAFFSRTPLIWFVHDFTFGAFWAQLLARIPQNIIYSSHIVREDLQNKIPSQHWKKLVHIPNGFDIKEVHKQAKNCPAGLKKTYSIPHDHLLVGLVGRIDWWKGQKEFILAAAEVISQYSSVHFLIIGDATQHDANTLNYKKECKQLADELNICDYITFTGHLSSVYGAINELDILVHASVQPEPFGRVVLESMALYTPIIASNLGGPAEIISDGIDGLLWNSPDSHDLAQKLMQLLTDRDLQNSLTNNGFKTVSQHYSLNTVAQKLNVLYCLPM